MTPLLWFLAGACFGALCGVVLMAVAMMWKEADAELDGWADEQTTWSVTDAGREYVRTEQRRDLDAYMLGRHDGIRSRPGPYDYREGL